MSIWTDLAAGGAVAKETLPPEGAAEVSKSVINGIFTSIVMFWQTILQMPLQQLCLLALAAYIASKVFLRFPFVVVTPFWPASLHGTFKCSHQQQSQQLQSQMHGISQIGVSNFMPCLDLHAA